MGASYRPGGGGKKGWIEQAYGQAEAWGIPVWCQDEAGPYQALPQPGASWQLTGQPAQRPHDYVRGGTAKLLTLFHPATGEVRAQAVTSTTNAVLHPWLQGELTAILATLPPALPAAAPGRQWPDWGWSEAGTQLWAAPEAVPPIRLILIWDNLRGHTSAALISWLVRHGVLPLYTPLGGAWLNMVESLQRILVRRALAGQQPESERELQQWLEATVVGWNRDPTPFVWGGKRAARRQRARERRHPLGGSGAYTHWPVRRLRHEERQYYNRYIQVN